MPPDSAAPFDYRLAIHQADAEIVGIIAQEFLNLVPGDLAQMREAASSDDRQRLGRLAHTYKGLAGNFGARPLQEHASDLHAACRDGGTIDTPLADMERELLALCAALEAHLAQNPT